MTQKLVTTLACFLSLLLLMALLWALTNYNAELPNSVSQHGAFFLALNRFTL